VDGQHGHGSVGLADHPAGITVLVGHVSRHRCDRRHVPGELASQAVGHHPTPRETGHVHPRGIDAVRRLEPLDQGGEEGHIIDPRVVAAAIRFPAIGNAVWIRHEPLQTLGLRVEARRELFQEPVGPCAVQVDHQAGPRLEGSWPVEPVMPREFALLQATHLDSAAPLGGERRPSEHPDGGDHEREHAGAERADNLPDHAVAHAIESRSAGCTPRPARPNGF